MNERISFALLSLLLSLGNLAGAIFELTKGKDRLLGRKTVAAIGTVISLQWGFVCLYILRLSDDNFERLNGVNIVSNIIFPISFLIPILSVYIIDTFFYYIHNRNKNKQMKQNE